MDDINVLAGRSLVYKVFQSLFGNPPSRQQLEVAAGETVLDSVHLLSEGSIDDSLIDRFVQEAEWSISHMEETRRSYDRLFVGPGFLPAPPWESVYICGERLLFQKSTLAIRKEYLDMGLLPTRYPHVADDHLALELDYMAFLSDQALASLESGDAHRALYYMKASEHFLLKHLTQWFPVFLSKLEEWSDKGLYLSSAQLLDSLMRLDVVALRHLSEQIDAGLLDEKAQ